MVPTHASYESEVLCNIRGFCFLGLGWGWHNWVCAQFKILGYRLLAVGPGTISSICLCLLLWLKESIPKLAARYKPHLTCRLALIGPPQANNCFDTCVQRRSDNIAQHTIPLALCIAL